LDREKGGREMNLSRKWTIKLAIVISVASWILPNEGSAQQMCGTTSAPAHNNGVGETYSNCAPLGPPVNESMAMAAAQSWQPSSGMGSQAQCIGTNPPQVVFKQTPNSCAIWAYSGRTTGHVHLNTASDDCVCPTLSDPTWN
jgi:hypothetical protein